MAEMERVKERERPPLQDNPYERSMRARAEFMQRNMTGPMVISLADRQWHQARQGKLLYLLCPASHKDTPLQHGRVFMHEIKTVSGKHKPQGGLLIYVLKGKGYSIVDE